MKHGSHEMRVALVLLLAAAAQPAQSHCYSVWRYPTPQHCGITYARVASVRMVAANSDSVPVPPVRDPGLDLPLPDLTAMTWDTPLDTPGQLELAHDMERLKALRKLEREMQ